MAAAEAQGMRRITVFQAPRACLIHPGIEAMVRKNQVNMNMKFEIEIGNVWLFGVLGIRISGLGLRGSWNGPAATCKRCVLSRFLNLSPKPQTLNIKPFP